MDAPEFGLHADVPFRTYCEWDAINSSTLCVAEHSAQMMKASLDGLLDSDKQHQRFGRAVHCRLLEPERFKTDFLIAKRCDTPLKSGANEGQPCGKWGRVYIPGKDNDSHRWICGIHAKGSGAIEPSDYINEEQLAEIEGVHASVFSHPVVKLLRQHGGEEMSAIWDCAGITAKARFDKLILGKETAPDTIIDVKKTRLYKSTTTMWEKSVKEYQYHIQAAFYVDAVASLTGKTPTFLWLIVEDKPPHCCNVIQCNRDTLAVGRQDYKRHVATYHDCKLTGDWPGPSYLADKGKIDIQQGGLPQYYLNQRLAI